MSISLSGASVAELDTVVSATASWQQNTQQVQLHPGDLGWHWRCGASVLAECLRVWRRDGEPVAMGFLDGATVVRMSISPAVADDAGTARAIANDLSDPTRGAVPPGGASAEVRYGDALRSELVARGWTPGEPWTPLVWDLREPVPALPSDLQVRVIGAESVADRVAVHRGSFDGSTFTSERWHTMAQAPPYRQARCLVGYAPNGEPAAGATVWSAGPGRPGLIEPMGAHREWRGRGYGRAITVAAVAALHEMGSSWAFVCTPSANVPGVQAYVSAGFTELPAVTDFRRPAGS